LIINILFSAVMLFLAFVDVRTYLKGEHKDLKSPILSLGILGTFFGIFLGLIGFDTSDIQQSVPKLLEGLKVAFFTSIAGMSVAISLFIFQKFNPQKETDLGELNEINEKLENLEQLNKLDHLEKLEMLKALYHQKSIDSSTKESLEELKSINRHIQNSHKATQDLLLASFEQVLLSLKVATEEIARGASKEIVDALGAVIKDFNQNLNEQFGDNFKELNEGVHNLISWQNNYKSHIESSEKSLKMCVESISSSKETLELIASKNDEITAVYRELSFIINTYSNQTKTLNALLSEFASLGDKSRESIESIEKLTETFYTSITDSKEEIVKRVDELLETNINSSTRFTTHLSELLQDGYAKVETLTQNTSYALTQTLSELSQNSKELIVGSLKQIEQDSIKTNQNISLSYETLTDRSVELTTNLTQKAAEYIEESNEKISKSFEGSTKVIEESSETISQNAITIREALAGILINFKQNLESIAENSINSMDETKQHMIEGSSYFIETMRENTQKQILEVSGSILDMNKLAKDSITESKEYGIRATENFFETIAQDSQKHILETKNRVLELSDETKMLIKDIKDLNTQAVKNYALESSTYLKEQTQDLVNFQKETLLSSLNSFKEGFKSMGDQFLESMQSVNRVSIEGHTGLLDAFLNAIDETLKKTLQNSSMFIKDSLGETKENYKLINQELKTLIEGVENLAKDSSEQSNISQKAIEKSFLLSAKAHKELSDKNDALILGIEKSFNEGLSTFARFGDEAKEQMAKLALSIDEFNTEFTVNNSESLNSMTREVKSGFKEIGDEFDLLVKNSIKNIAYILEEATSSYIKTLEATANEGKEIPIKIANNIKTSFLQVQKDLMDYSKSTNSSIYNTKNIIEELANEMKKQTTIQLEENKTLNEELQKSLRILDNSMHSVITGFKNDYEWLLRRIRELMGSDRL